ncbi:MAG TPA: mechanosensitive ion channel family protein, partial [Flavisolibacter sp.]|nr:mechanosensitive ion channel family protein [Flavisolibacter sp.]
MQSFWDQVIGGNAIRDWAIAFAVIAIAMVLLRFFKYVVLQRLKKLADRSKSRFDDLLVSSIVRFLLPLLYCFAVYYGLQYLTMNEKARQLMHVAIMVVATFFIIRTITSVISYFIHNFIRNESAEETKRKQARGILLIIKGVVWLVGLVFLIDNLGYDITTIVTGLGIGGIAIALAAQTVLGDLFSYLVIFFDKPFEIGDFI